MLECVSGDIGWLHYRDSYMRLLLVWIHIWEKNKRFHGDDPDNCLYILDLEWFPLEGNLRLICHGAIDSRIDKHLPGFGLINEWTTYYFLIEILCNWYLGYMCKDTLHCNILVCTWTCMWIYVYVNSVYLFLSGIIACNFNLVCGNSNLYWHFNATSKQSQRFHSNTTGFSSIFLEGNVNKTLVPGRHFSECNGLLLCVMVIHYLVTTFNFLLSCFQDQFASFIRNSHVNWQRKCRFYLLNLEENGKKNGDSFEKSLAHLLKSSNFLLMFKFIWVFTNSLRCVLEWNTGLWIYQMQFSWLKEWGI